MVEIDQINDAGSRIWVRQVFKGWRRMNNQKGFTLLEMMSILVILGTIFSITIKKFDLISDAASSTALKAGLRELNTRETLVWTNIKLSDEGWKNDVEVFNTVDKQIGKGYSWNPAPDPSGGKLQYKTQATDLNRKTSTTKSVGVWN